MGGRLAIGISPLTEYATDFVHHVLIIYLVSSSFVINYNKHCYCTLNKTLCHVYNVTTYNKHNALIALKQF